jgi:hypothetical protein
MTTQLQLTNISYIIIMAVADLTHMQCTLDSSSVVSCVAESFHVRCTRRSNTLALLTLSYVLSEELVKEKVPPSLNGWNS